jgi:hypothetical protein
MKMIVLFFSILTVLTASAAINDQDKAKLLSEVNLLPNPGFEGSTGGWTASAGTFSATSTNPFTGKLSGAWNPSAGSETLSSEAITIQQGFLGRTCQAEMLYTYSGSSGDLVLEALDTGSAVATLDIDPATTPRKAQLVFDCPDTNTDTLQLRLRSTVDAGEIKFDDAFLGRDRNTFQLSQAAKIASANYAPTANCIWAGSPTSGFANFAADSDCPDETVTGIASVSGDDLPSIVLNNVPAGTLEVVVSGFFNISSVTSSQECEFRLSDGSQGAGFTSIARNSASGANPDSTIIGSFDYASPQSSVTIQIQASEVVSDTGECQVVANSFGRNLNFQVYHFPNGSSKAITLETSGWFIDGTIQSGSPGLGTTTVASESLVTNSSFSLQTNTSNGSQPAFIACQGSEVADVGCVGDPSLGLAFNVPTAGNYDVCVNFAQEMETNNVNGSSVTTTWSLYHRANNNSSTLIAGGNNKDQTRLSDGTAGSGTALINRSDVDMCERFRFDVGLQTVNVYYTQIVTGSGITQSAAVPTYRFLVTKVDQQFPTPVFTDLQESLQARVESGSAFQQRLEYFQINCSSPATAVQEVSTAGMITSVGARVSGQCAVFFEAGVWNQNPYCVGVNSNISAGAGSFTGLEITTNNLTQVTIQGLDGSTGNPASLDYNARVICAGSAGSFGL